jgi:hypothetical protein
VQARLERTRDPRELSSGQRISPATRHHCKVHTRRDADLDDRIGEKVAGVHGDDCERRRITATRQELSKYGPEIAGDECERLV